MAAATNSTDKEREGPRCAVPSNIQRHNSPETANRDRRQQRRSLEVCKTREIRHEIKIRARFTIQLSSSSVKGYGIANHSETVPSCPCKQQ